MTRGDDKWLHHEKAVLTAHIESAFSAASRREGISWSEAAAIDAYASEVECRDARLADTDRYWIELVNDESWDPDPSCGGFTFLDAAGFRYYLPAAMTRLLEADAWTTINSSLCYHLTRAPDEALPERWSRLDRRQQLAIKRFVEYVIELSRREDPSGIITDSSHRAYESHWEHLG